MIGKKMCPRSGPNASGWQAGRRQFPFRQREKFGFSVWIIYLLVTDACFLNGSCLILSPLRLEEGLRLRTGRRMTISPVVA